MANEVRVYEMTARRAADPIMVTPFRAKQTISHGAASNAFNRSTTMVRVVCTATTWLEFGTAPDGTGITYPMVADVPQDFSVIAGQKVYAKATE